MALQEINFKVNNIKSSINHQHALHAKIPSTLLKTYKQALVCAKLDSGASKNYFKPTDQHVLQNVHKIQHGPTVTFPNNATSKPTHNGNLPLQHVSSRGSSSYILPGLTNANLVSVGQLCDDDCQVLFTKQQAIVSKNNKLVTIGTRNHQDGLWDIHFNEFSTTSPSSNHASANAVITLNQTKVELLQYLHACLFSPTKSTLLKAILNNNLITFPGLDNIKFVKKHLENTLDTFAGHQQQERQNIQSTKSNTSFTRQERQEQDTLIQQERDSFPLPEFPNSKSYHCFALLTDFNATNKAYGDLTGKFPIESSRGNKYLLIIYDYDSNAILATALQNRQAGTIKKGWEKLHTILATRGAAPKLYIMDNEASLDLKSSMTKNNIAYELVPPMVHRRNAAERAIQTFKNHFLAGLASVDPNFPISEWDRLLPQALLTLNLLRHARVNPKLSSYAYLFGVFDFNKTPLAPPGTRVSVHNKADQRASWARRGLPAWYTGPALDHYRCVTCFDPTTKQERICDSVQFLPHKIPFPKVTIEDYIKQSVTDLVRLLQAPSSTTSPHLKYGDSTLNAFHDIAQSLQRIQSSPPSTSNKSSSTSTTVVDKSSTNDTADISSVPSEKQPVSVPRVVSPSASPTRVKPPTKQPVSVPRVVSPPASPTRVQPASVPRVISPKSPSEIPSVSSQSASQQKIVPAPPPKGPYFPRHSYGTRFKAQAAEFLLAQHLFGNDYFPVVNHIYNEFGKRETVDTLINGPNKDVWLQALSNEFGRCAQGNDAGVRYTDAIEFIPKSEVPKDRKVTYVSFVCDERPLKTEPYRIRMVVGGDKLSYESDAGSPAAGLIETKIILNSVISDAKYGARFFTADLKDHFLASPMERPEYMRIHISRFPPDIIRRYKLMEIVAEDGYVYVKIKRGMYGLRQAAILAYRHLVKVLAPHGYHPCKYSLGLWKHKTRKTVFCLCVDDFGVKYFNQEDKDHLLNALRQHYKITVDDEGRHYCGLTIEWNYIKGYVDISMPGYSEKVRERLKHPKPNKPQYAPHKWYKPTYGQKTQLVRDPDTSPLLEPNDTTYIQSGVGAHLYYGRAIEHPMLVALNELGHSQSKPTENTMRALKQLLDYAATRPDAKIRFYASDMILYVDSDAAYLVLPNAKSRAAGYYYLSNLTPAQKDPPINGAIWVECRTLPIVASSAAEAETGALFLNAQRIIPIRIMLEEIGHPQPGPTPLKTDNSTAVGFCNKTIKQKQSKAWDMRYHWLREKELHKLIKVYWDQGLRNLADYFTKHFAIKYHKEIRSKYILSGHVIQQSLNSMIESTLRGCIDSHRCSSHFHVARSPKTTVAPTSIATAIFTSLNNSSLINLLT